MRIFFVAILTLAAITRSTYSEVIERRDFGLWHYEYNYSNSGTGISYCGAGVVYRNAWLTVRIFGDDLDIIFQNDEFSLPAGMDLGFLIMKAGGRSFLLRGSTSKKVSGGRRTTSILFATPSNQDVKDLYRAMKRGSQMRISFPDGSTYQVPLSGSGPALAAASRCWSRNPTGRGGRNPFDRPGGKRNPFDA